MLDVCDPAEEFGCRNRAIILLFLNTGIVGAAGGTGLGDPSGETVYFRHATRAIESGNYQLSLRATATMSRSREGDYVA